jgi:hypothetical protein
MSTLIPEALTLSHVGKDVEQVAQLLTTGEYIISLFWLTPVVPGFQLRRP